MITTIKEWKKFNENLFLEGKKDILKQDMIKLLSQEIIKSDLEIDKTFEGIPENLIKIKQIKGDVTIEGLNYIPSWLKNVKIYGDFNCSYNKLKNLENCPQYVGGNFDCSWNKLTSLKGCPKYIGGNLLCNANNKMLEEPEGIRLKGDFEN